MLWWRRVGKWEVIFNWAPLLCRRGRRNWLACLVTGGRVLSEMHISLKKNSCTDFFQSLYVCGSTRDPKQHPKSQGKCCFHNMSPLGLLYYINQIIKTLWESKGILDFLLRKQISVSGSPTDLTFSQQSQAAVVSAGGIMCHTQPTPHTHKKRPHYVNTVDITNLRGAPALPFRKAPPQVHGNVLLICLQTKRTFLMLLAYCFIAIFSEEFSKPKNDLMSRLAVCSKHVHSSFSGWTWSHRQHKVMNLTHPSFSGVTKTTLGQWGAYGQYWVDLNTPDPDMTSYKY